MEYVKRENSVNKDEKVLGDFKSCKNTSKHQTNQRNLSQMPQRYSVPSGRINTNTKSFKAFGFEIAQFHYYMEQDSVPSPNKYFVIN